MADILCLGEPMLEFNAQKPGADGRRTYLEGHGGDTSNAAIAAARPLMVAAFRPRSVALIATTLPGTSAKVLAKLERVTAARITALGSRMEMLPPCPHYVAALASQLTRCSADLLLVAGASATVDRGDVIPQAIIAAGGTVERLGMPVDPGNLLVLGTLAVRPQMPQQRWVAVFCLLQ